METIQKIYSPDIDFVINSLRFVFTQYCEWA